MDFSRPIPMQPTGGWAGLQRRMVYIAVSRCAGLIESDPHRLSAATEAKGAFTKYWLEGDEYLCSHLFYIVYF